MARMNATLVFAIMRVAVLNMLPNLVMKSDSKKLGSNLIFGRLWIFTLMHALWVFWFLSGFATRNIFTVIFSGQAGFELGFCLVEFRLVFQNFPVASLT